MFIVEIYNRADFYNIVKRFVCADEGRANFWAGFHVDRLADSGDEYDNFDYRIIACEELK